MNFEHFCITHEKSDTTFPQRTVTFMRLKEKCTKLANFTRLYHILQHFETKHDNFTKLRGLFPNVLMIDDRKEWLSFVRILSTFSFKKNIVIVTRTSSKRIGGLNDYEKITRDS